MIILQVTALRNSKKKKKAISDDPLMIKLIRLFADVVLMAGFMKMALVFIGPSGEAELCPIEAAVYEYKGNAGNNLKFVWQKDLSQLEVSPALNYRQRWLVANQRACCCYGGHSSDGHSLQ